MELWQLRTFSTVAKNLHFTRAAEELNLSQPAVSHHIKSLEDEIGEPLFLRNKDGIWLTKAGHTMYEHATKILDIADEMRLEIKDTQANLSGKIVLGAVTRGLGNPISLFYQDFKKVYRDIELVMQTAQKLDDIVEEVRNGNIDIGMVTHNLDLSGLAVIPYGEYELILAVGKNHRLAKKGQIEPADLQNEEWAMFEPTNKSRMSANDYLGKIEIAPQKIYETNDGSMIRSMITHGNKIGLLPEWGVFEELKDGRIVSIKVKGMKGYKVPINLIWKESRRTKLMSAVLTYLLQAKLEGVQLITPEE
jgi:LysR family transcriptional regulator, transcriptional activator of the cysJI operon